MVVVVMIDVSHYGRSRGGLGGSVEPPKLNVKTYNKCVVKKKLNQGDFRAIKPLQIAPENAGNSISEVLNLKIIYCLWWPSVGIYPNPHSSNPGSAPEPKMLVRF